MTSPSRGYDWQSQDLLTVADAADLLGWDKQKTLSWLKRRAGDRSLEGGEIEKSPARSRWRVTRRSVNALATTRPDLLGPSASWLDEGEPGGPGRYGASGARPNDIVEAPEATHSRTDADVRVAHLVAELELTWRERDELRNRVANLEQTALLLNQALVTSHSESAELLQAQADALRVWLVRDNPVLHHQGAKTP